MPTSKKGTYLLILKANNYKSIEVGKLALLGLEPKQYLYVGSAFGPGGLRARLKHHLRASKKPHWHIDYLRQHVNIELILYSTSELRLEHNWANKLIESELTSIPCKGFGASDCNCKSHLFSVKNTTAVSTILDILDKPNKYNIKVFAPQPKS